MTPIVPTPAQQAAWDRLETARAMVRFSGRIAILSAMLGRNAGEMSAAEVRALAPSLFPRR